MSSTFAPPKSSSGITLYSWPTPNGVKASIILEELKEAKEISDYAVVPINISLPTEPQKTPEFISHLNPNGRIPAIYDANKKFSVFESGSILLYLSKHYSPSHFLDFDGSDGTPELQSELLQWIFFQAGGLGPMQGQLGHFKGAVAKVGEEKAGYGVERYGAETKRLLEVYEARLNGRNYLVGSGRGKYSLADIMTWGWARLAPGMLPDKFKGEFPNLHSWIQRIAERPAVKRGIVTPPRE